MIITLEKYMKVQELQKLHAKDSDALGIAIIKLFKAQDAPIEEATALLTDITKQLLHTKDLPLVHRFKQDGISFGFIPNLEDITVGEFIDLDALMQKDNLQLDQLMSVLYRPVKKSWFNTYSIEPYTGTDKYIETYLKTDFRIILGAIFFFALLKRSLLNHLDTYTQEKNLEKEKV